jgi:hypothetical protein
MTSCFSLISNYRDISYNKYIFHNNVTNVSYGLYPNLNNNYLIRGVPYNYPLTFFSQTQTQTQAQTDISNILRFGPLSNNPIIIYVSRGQDISFNNGDYFRFYDQSFQLLNINHGYRRVYDSSLTDVRSNFYFMNNRSYKFIAGQDFSSSFPFTISGNLLTTGNTTLNTSDNSFIINIPNDADNSGNKLFYRDLDNDISGNLYILRDVSGLKYYYGDISFSYIYNVETSNVLLSIKSYDFSYGTSVPDFGNKDVSNNNFFYYSSTCQYVITNNLPNNNEFLNKVSAIDISLSDTNTMLSFNKNRHSSTINSIANSNPSIIYDLSFGLGKGSYIIVEISSNYPMRLKNEDISNLIAIDISYQPARLKSNTYAGQKYYYGSLKIKVFNDFSSVDIEIYNKTTATPRTHSGKFFYTELPHISGGTYGTVGTSYLKLKNQQDVYYNYSESPELANRYQLDLDKQYKEYSYLAADKYGHNLNILDFVKSIPPNQQAVNDEISNNIINNTFDYNIIYNVTDYEDTTIQNIRYINVNSGPIIEISSNYFNTNSIYKNDNQYNNVLLFQNNTFDLCYNFFKAINVYIFDISRRRINIPFEVSISGYYHDNSRNITPLAYPNETFSYTDSNSSIQPILRFSNNNLYSYYTNFLGFRNTGSDSFLLKNYDISSRTISNQTSFILDSTNINTLDICNNTISIKSGVSTSSSITINSIEQNFDSSSTTLFFNSKYTTTNNNGLGNIIRDLSCSLKLNNYFFELSFNSPSRPIDNLKISGRFNDISFVGKSNNKSLIDLSFVGSYDIKITTKSLSSGDYFYDTFKTKFFKPTITDISRTYKLFIQDTIRPTITFYDTSFSRNDTRDVLDFPRIRRFKLLEDICFVDLKYITNYANFITNYVSNKPLIEFSDNSIYDLSYLDDISFTIIGSGLGTNITYHNTPNIKELSLNNITLDASCIINYRAKDICNNWSQDISLTLNFINIPYAELIGSAIRTVNFSRNANYSDDGIIIYSNQTTSTPFIPRTLSGSIINEISNITVGVSRYDISFNTDLCLNVVGDYSFNYIITISNSGTRVPVNLKRKVSIIDSSNPYFLFRDFSAINYTLTDVVMNNNNYEASLNLYPLRDTSFIDFSLVVNRPFADLSKVLYDFDVCDNYLVRANMTTKICFSNNSFPFTFNDISNYFDTSPDKRLNKVTISDISRSLLPQLQFIYTISGPYNNETRTRRVHIIDNSVPTIEFSFNNYYRNNNNNNNNYNYVYFDASYTDFSYVALDHTKTYRLGEVSFNFIQELSSILFNFDLSDNLDLKSNIKYQITISNNSYRQSISRISDLELSSNNMFKKLFSKKDTSFVLIYDICDNQYNSITRTRNVKIIDISTNLDISFLNNSSNLTISFGDTNFNIFQDVSFNHKRLTIASISFDISYIFPNAIPSTNTITSVSGRNNTLLFDPSALIYRLGSNNVNYFPTAYTSDFYKKERTIDISNRGPLISFPDDISHEIYTTLSDASLINGVISISIYDAFIFKNYRTELSYNGTNFKVTFDNCLNIFEPSFGIYNIYYSSTDLCGITTRRTRKLDVADRRPPIITICGDFVYEFSGNNSYYLPDNSFYIEQGAYAYDVGTRTQIYDISITKTSQQKIVNTISDTFYYVNISNETLATTRLLYDTNSLINPDYKVIYRATDALNNYQDICRNIFVTISRKPKLYPYIEVSNNNGLMRYSLLDDISINKQLTININSEDLIYDLSLTFKYDRSRENNQNIICEAVKHVIFGRNRPNNYVKFVLDASNYQGGPLNRSYITVAHEPINSINTNSEIGQKIYFYARDLSQDPINQLSFLEYNLYFEDRTPPQVGLLSNRNYSTNSDYTNIYDLTYPLLSATSVNDLKLNINSYDNFNNLYNKYEKFYKQSLANLNIVLYDPGINIKDIVDGEVNYIDSSFIQIIRTTILSTSVLSYNFLNSDISINYYRVSDGSLIDVCNILFDGCSNNFVRNYSQRYKVNDRSIYNNKKDISRNIYVTRFPPFINLNYQSDCCSNKYITYYHKKFEKYVEPKGIVVDYFDGLTLSFENVKITNTINENRTGMYTIKYDVSNSANIFNIDDVRKVNVINTFPLQQQFTYNFDTILNFNLLPQSDNSYNKYSLYNGTYKFDVSQSRAISIRTQEFDICNGLYDISNVVTLTSESYNTINNKKFYYNSVSLTISGDFNKLAFEISNNIISPHLFVYDDQNTYVNMYDVIYNNEYNVIIDGSYIVNIQNLNVANSSPYFEFASTSARDLYLSIGNYRFYQIGYNNFHNPIKFSTTKDGTHNGGIEYTKNVFRRNLPGVSILSRNLNSNSSYMQINIDATTPSTLYYYCENFPNMGGQIKIKNNIIFSKDALTLNAYVIDANNEINILNANYRDEELLKNRILLTQRFNISGGDMSHVNITCITQRNIQHNMLYNLQQLPHKLIIRKHINLTSRSDVSFVVDDINTVMRDNVENYLVENRGSGYTFDNTYINLFKCEFDTSLNISKRSTDPLLDIYDHDIRPIFYNNKNYNYFTNATNPSNPSNPSNFLHEILNYSEFFRSNKLLTPTLLVNSFQYKISDFFFMRNSKILNLDFSNEYIFNNKLLAPRIKISKITGNYVTFTLMIYYNTNNNWYLPYSVLNTNKELLFGTYEYIVYSDRLTQFARQDLAPATRDFITFYNGSITITSNIIYSYNKELSNNFYSQTIFNSIGHNDLSNTVFLSMKDNSNNNASVCGLTKKNLYNNVYFDNSQILIFRKFGEKKVVNYQVNTPALTLQDTLKEETNSDNYLIDICTNDIYKFFDNRPLTFNTLRDLSFNEEYNIYIAFTIHEELTSISNNILTQYEIDPIYLNNIPIKRIGYIYREYSDYPLNSYDSSINTITETSYNALKNQLGSHSYIIDLNDYFDISIYKQTLIATNVYTSDFIDTSKLRYTLLDLSFSKEFNLYDMTVGQTVIFNATNLNMLLTMRNRIIPIYYKLRYMINILAVLRPNVVYNRAILIIKDDDSINYYINLLSPDPSNLIVNIYTNNVSINRLNALYKEIFDNAQLMVLRYDEVIKTYTIAHTYLVTISDFLNMVINFDYLNINYLDNILTLLERNIEAVLLDIPIYNDINNIRQVLTINNLPNNIVLINNGTKTLLEYNDISNLKYCFTNFYFLANELDLMRKEIAVRNYGYGLSFELYKYDMASNTTNNSLRRYENMFSINNLDVTNLYNDLKYNFKLLNNNFILDYSYVLHNYMTVASYYSPPPNPTNIIINYPAYNDASINNYATLYNNVENLYNIITSVFSVISRNYEIYNKPTLYVNTTYEFYGSKLLINSYYSNSITLKLKLQYVKSLYHTIELSNIYLDITIPDIIPPTLLFNNSSDICFNENVFNYDASVNELIITKLISDISYIDFNQLYQISSANYTYYNSVSTITNNILSINRTLVNSNKNSLLEIDFTDISAINFGGQKTKNSAIKYIISDNANNRNTIIRRITLINDNTEPIFFYNNQAYYVSTIITNKPLSINETITENEFITKLRTSVIVLNPLLHEMIPNLFTLTEPPRDLSFIAINYIQIVNVVASVDEVILTINNVNFNGPIISYPSVTIKSFNGFINNDDDDTLYIKYFSSTQVYDVEGIFKIKLEIIRKEIVAQSSIDTHCCYPKVDYKPIQDSYKLGSQNSTVMRRFSFLLS